MHPDELKGKWHQIKGKFRERWSKITDDEWQQVQGNKEKIIGKIQEKYGISKDQAEKEVCDFFKKCKDECR
jgi:uncharacterized protein YjbJ (UPF0337 family)